jgi:hypothetical protein
MTYLEQLLFEYESECEANDQPPTLWGILKATWEER